MSYIFVGGSQRSGTTLLAASLCAGEETNQYLGESGSLRRLLQVHEFMDKRFDDEVVFHFGSRAVTDEYFGECIRSFLSHTLAVHTPASSLILKEPHLTTHFPLISRLIPTAKFAMIIRDPRDIITSMLTVGEKLAESNKKSSFTPDNVKSMTRTVAAFYRPVLREYQTNPAFKNAVRWVKYESLVEKPEETMERMRKFTELKLELYDPKDPTKRTHPAKVKSRKTSKRGQPWNSDLMKQKGVSTKSKGSYKNKLTDEQIEIIEKSAPGLFKRFNYTLESA